MVYDFNKDGKAEIAVKTAPGTKMMCYEEMGHRIKECYITIPKKDML